MERTNYFDRLNFFRGLAILFGVGFFSHLIPPLLPLMKAITPLFLLLCAGIILAPEIRKKNYRLLVWIAVVAAATWLIENIGVATGMVFGKYEYGTVLGRHLVNVPPIIGVNWAIVALGSISLARILLPAWRYNLLLAPAIVVFFDVFMEPVAVALGYWHWFGADIPARNYIAWGIITTFAAGLWKFTGVTASEKLPAFYLAVMTFYFLFLGLVIA